MRDVSKPRPFGSPAAAVAPATATPAAQVFAPQPPARLAGTAAVAKPARRRRYRRLTLAAPLLILLALASAYAAAPLATAWSIREAVRTGDANYLRGSIEWPRIKETLKVSLYRYAVGPAHAASVLPSGATAPLPADAAQPGLWQRIKQAYGWRVVEGLVENYVTPEGLPQLLAWRRGVERSIGRTAGIGDDAPIIERIRHEWARVKSARFVSPTRFAIEIADRFEDGRRIAGVLEFASWSEGLGWKLVSLEVKGVEQAGVPPPRAASAREATLR